MVAGWLLLALSAQAKPDQPGVTPFDWSTLELGPRVERLEREAHTVVRVEREEGGEKIRVATLSSPNVSGPRWMVRGVVRHRDVEGRAYLMTENRVGGQDYFSKTLGTGPLAPLTGTSGWRPFVLPFDARGGGPPSRIALFVVLPGEGTVDLGKVELVDLAHAHRGVLTPWEAGLFFGLAGALFGLIAAAMVVLAGRGQARQGVMTVWAVMTFACVAGLAFGLAALVTGQPFHVTGGFLGLGMIGLGTLLPLKRVLDRRYSTPDTVSSS